MKKDFLPSSKLVLLALCAVLLSACEEQKQFIFEKAIGLEYALSDLQKKSINIDDFSISYLHSELDAGEDISDKDVLLLLHGFSADKENWARFSRELNDSTHVVIPDLPAHGESTYLEGADYDTATQAKRVLAFMDALGVKQFAVAGNSMGGAIATQLTVLAPTRVTHLILMNSGGVDDPHTQSDYEIALSNNENPLLVENADDFANTMDFAMSKKPFLPWPIADVKARQSVARADINKDIFADIKAEPAFDKTGMLAQVSVPTLILWGEDDRLLHVENANIFAEQIAGAQLIVFADIGHMPMLETPVESANAVNYFLSAEPKLP